MAVRPTQFDPKRIQTLSEAERIFRDSHVELRGWDYPHNPKDGVRRYSDYIEGTVDWDSYHELWRVYQSAQFVHLFAMREDWWAESAFGDSKVKPGEVLSLTSTLYTVTEIFLFAARFSEKAALGPDVSVSYRLVGLEGRHLQTFDPNRVPLDPWRRAASDLHEYGETLSISVAKLLGDPSALAVDQTLAIYERFNWSPARENVVEEQRKFIERRI